MTLLMRSLIVNLMLLALTGCAGLPADFEEPSLTVTSIAFRNSNSISPQFDIMLHITNPNRVALNLRGMSYSVSLAGHKVVTGVANNLPVVDAYGEADVPISAAVSLFGSIRLLNELMVRNPNQIDYLFDARLDIGARRPRLSINRSGFISLTQPR